MREMINEAPIWAWLFALAGVVLISVAIHKIMAWIGQTFYGER